MQAIERQSAGTGASIRDRMAMLQLDQVGRGGGARGPISPPPPPPRPPLPSRASTTTTTTTSITSPRRQLPPPLPARKASHSSLAESFVSVASTNSTNSSGSNTTTRSVPPVYTGRESLPFQFPEKKKPEPVRRASTLPPIGHGLRGVKPKPPPLPARRITADGCPTASSPVRRVPPLPARTAENSPALPSRPRMSPEGPPPVPRNTRPPPVPISSRPVSISARPQDRSPLPCLICYDFSGPDRHAGLPQFHRSRATSLPSLALALTEPFPSALEKARVLFTWLHHNISYDVTAFFGNAIPAQDPRSTLRSGLAVCAGYAELFAALAFHAGLEAVVVMGHGKGYGHSSNPDAPYEPKGHAWNAVKLAPDYWHLIDPCWGAGHIKGPPTPTYTAAFSAANFISPPSTFGRFHFPENSAYQHREDGRVLTWAEYVAPEPESPICYTQFTDLFNFSKETLRPATRRIEGGRRERFAVTLPCQHLPAIAPRDEYVLFLNVGEQFEPKNFYVLQPDGTGRGFACEVEIPREPGVKVTLNYVKELDGCDGKGLGKDRFVSRVGRCGWQRSQIVEWGGAGRDSA